MIVSKLELRNWRNFTQAEVKLDDTVFMLGPNASGKSNLLDVFRFLRDIVTSHGGGLQQAVKLRGGLPKVRSLAARRNPRVEIKVELREDVRDDDGHDDAASSPPAWRYELSFGSEQRGKRRPIIYFENVFKDGKQILSRPANEDKKDKELLTQTHLEQINMNGQFREIAQFFSHVMYLHLVPQLLKYGSGNQLINGEDPFGQRFLEQIAETSKRTRDSRLKRIETILKKVIPHFEELRFLRDKTTGQPHIEMRYRHWRPNAGWQREDQFSDGTLRLIALMWSLLTTNNLILLEEPELSLHERIVEQIPKLINDARRSRKRSGGQILISTHSETMLASHSIRGSFLLLKPGEGGESTEIWQPNDHDISAMRAGLSPADVLLPQVSSTIGRV